MADLDDAYANAAHIQGADEFPPRWAAAAAAFRDRHAAEGRAELGIAYGDSERQAYDLFLPDRPPEGLSIFVHGGYWLRFDRSFWSHFASGVLDRGYACAMPSYDLCPDVRVADITRQIARAVSHAANRVAGPITLAGHSAGGHLVARMLAPGMLAPALLERLTYVAPISPVADLRPLLRTSMNEQFQLDEAAAEAESPIFQPAPRLPVCVWVGAEERPVFLEQASALAEAWTCPRRVERAKHHFDVIDMLTAPEHLITRRLSGQPPD